MSKKRSFVIGYAVRTVCSVLLGILRVVLSLSFVWVCKRMVDIATGNLDLELMTYVWILIGILFMQLVSQVADMYLYDYNVQVTKISLQRSIFKRVLGSTWQGKELYRSGDVTSRLHEDVSGTIEMMCRSIPALFVSMFQLLASSMFLFKLAPNLLWLILGIMILGVVGSKILFSSFRTLTNYIRRTEAELQQQIQENLLNRILVITLFGIDNVLSKFDVTQKKIFRAVVKRLNYRSFAVGAVILGFSGAYAVTFLWGVFGITKGVVTFGMMTAFLQLIGQIHRPISDMVRQIPSIIKSLTSVERILELYEMAQDHTDENDYIEEPPTIRVNNVSYSYPIVPTDNRGSKEQLSTLLSRIWKSIKGENIVLARSADIQYKDVLKDFSCEFPAGTMTAIIGPTGRGKSTLTRLVLSVLKPTEGNICFVANDGEHPCGAAQRCNFMYVPQGNTLISGTIRDNLLMAVEKGETCTEEKMKEALHTAVADFVWDLPDKLDTVCGETGTGLSEGQAQRIAVARALLRRGSVLILDEATSALDAETENTLLERLKEKYSGKKTILFVSHREKVTEEADQIIKL